MANYSKRVVRTMAPVESMSGKFAQKKVVAGDGQKVYIGVVRSTSARNYFALRVKKMVYKSAQDQADAEARQLKFKAVAANARDRMTDPTKITVDKANFLAQTKYKTFFGYVFHLEWEAYEGD